MNDPLHAVDTSELAATLGPVLVHQCAGRLTDAAWFRSTWQRGGAATAFATWHCDEGPVPVMVKMPVGPTEYRWTRALSDSGDRLCPTPRVLASDERLGGYDLAWLVVERLDGHTLHHEWSHDAAVELLHAAAAFQARAARVASPTAAPSPLDWDKLIHRARDLARESALPEAQHWNDAVKKVLRVLPRLTAKWHARPINSWCHGDLHPGNAMRRMAAAGAKAAIAATANADAAGRNAGAGRADNGSVARAPCVLIDLALVHAGHWVEDAVYLERQFWGHMDQLFGLHVVSTLARHRREIGLPTDGDYGAIANLRRLLMASIAPVNMVAGGGESSPKYLHAALETIERLLPQLAH
ncbi:MAG: aminoglycoside phosphotransferase family protein [Phycisphaerales bacterium]